MVLIFVSQQQQVFSFNVLTAYFNAS